MVFSRQYVNFNFLSTLNFFCWEDFARSSVTSLGYVSLNSHSKKELRSIKFFVKRKKWSVSE